MITRAGLADEIDTIDQSIDDLNGSKRDAFAAYRAQLEAEGRGKPAIKAEIDAVKAAIRRRRALLKDEDAVEEKDALVKEILSEIRVSRAAHARVETAAEFGARAA